MSEMVNKVARAIVTHFRDSKNPLEGESLRQAAILFEPAARAALEAIRNPTDAMLDAATEGDWDPLSVWKKMIAAALQ